MVTTALQLEPRITRAQIAMPTPAMVIAKPASATAGEGAIKRHPRGPLKVRKNPVAAKRNWIRRDPVFWVRQGGFVLKVKMANTMPEARKTALMKERTILY